MSIIYKYCEIPQNMLSKGCVFIAFHIPQHVKAMQF